jgi:hypothetical protein
VRKRLERKESAFDLGRLELPVAIAALIWGAVALFVLVAPADGATLLIVMGLLLVGGLYFLGLLAFNREVLETKAETVEVLER